MSPLVEKDGRVENRQGPVTPNKGQLRSVGEGFYVSGVNESADPALERRVVSKMGRHIIPLIFTLCPFALFALLCLMLGLTREAKFDADLLSYLDRSNIGWVAHLALSSDEAPWLRLLWPRMLMTNVVMLRLQA